MVLLGGTSSINYMHFNRGSPRDYDAWANASGDPSWNYYNMLPFLKRIETYAGEYKSDQHSYYGPVLISRPQYAPGLDYWLEAGRQLGYRVRDPNGPQKESFTKIEFSKLLGRRGSSYTAYITPIIASLPNLVILTNVNATKILLKGKKAVGVKFETKLTNSTVLEDVVYAKKEIIISAGTYGSPVLLMRSGIGPKDVLEAAKIPVLHELPVGNNLHNHVSMDMDFLINTSTAVIDPARDYTAENMALFNQTGDGPFSSSGGGTGQAFVVSSVAKSEGEGDWPDIHFTMAHSTESYLAGTGNGGAPAMDFTNSTEVPMAIEAFVSRPKSRGTIKLDPANPFGPPLIDPMHLSDPRDLQIALEAAKESIRIMETTKSYAKLGAKFNVTAPLPACANFTMRSDDFFKCYITQLSSTGCHPVGSCKMGQATNDTTAVVDPQLRVIGIDRLRIVDASVMPNIVNANTQVAVYAIAERAAQLIIQDWQSGKPSTPTVKSSYGLLDSFLKAS
ncbi:Glucose dehydrogenase [FAD, quinone] [Orchesella cincta]|uniref:Glucose dehydrogenase [FAD, quinone] n=1 Tax=Orchesella cincta TaxID=48709 RepID=A0A1D2MK47_ORCCI|nr:Glucose dehydrogenase [FAD, quinone] [Orchesella cincta]